MDKQNQIFAVAENGSLKMINLLIKVHPHINGRVLFIGLFQKLKKFEGMEKPKEEYSFLEQHYILTDNRGYIMNVTDGLFHELGLHPRYFNYEEGDIASMVCMDHLCPNIMDSDTLQSL